MEFAKRQLEKYGWTEGQGLGKNEDGIVKAIKPRLKFDNAGLGHDISQEFNPWWQKLYDEASSNVVTKKQNGEMVIELKKESTSERKKSKDQNLDFENKKYKGFIRTSELNGVKEKKFCNSAVNNESEVKKDDVYEITDLLNDDELLKVCGGRTAHKGARHGLKMSAKLARIEEQEKRLMRSEENIISEESELSEVNFKRKKKAKKKE